MTLDTATLERLRSALRRAMEGTVGHRNPRPAVLDEARAVALEAAKALAGPSGALDEAAYETLDRELPADLRAWLLELPSFLSKKGRRGQGEELCDLYAPILGAPYLEAERAVVAWEAGARDEARRALEEVRSRHPEHPWPELRGGYCREQEKREEDARKHFETAVEKARRAGRPKDLRFAWDGLIQFHHARGDRDKAVELSRKMLEECPDVKKELEVETIVNEARSPGRNDRCPCGSGRKWKKCCGRAV
jgi:tetratricopeptide (TPR) repeat protein